jgi:ABC-type transporter Mla maintaining outer membrane lipid asymmetry ATPase subunit MlaF
MVVTHDLDFARAVSDRIAVLVDGRIAQAGPADEVLASAHPAVQAFLAGQAARAAGPAGAAAARAP